MPFSYINDASNDLNEVCLHITYLFLKELVFVSDFFLLFICCPKRICIHCQKWYQESFHLLYSANLFICVLITCLFILLSWLIFFFQIDRLEPSFTDSVFRFRFRFWIPCFSATVENMAILRLRPRKLIFLLFSKIKGFLREQLTSDYLST